MRQPRTTIILAIPLLFILVLGATALMSRAGSSASVVVPAGITPEQLEAYGVTLYQTDRQPTVPAEAAAAAARSQFAGAVVKSTLLVALVDKAENTEARLAWAVTYDPKSVHLPPACGPAPIDGVRADYDCPSSVPVFMLSFVDAQTGAPMYTIGDSQ
jgi:hypothetical protein